MPTACTFDSLYVAPSTVPGGEGTGGAITITLVTSHAGTMTVSSLAVGANSSSGTAGSSTSGSVSVVAGDLVALQGTGAGFTSGTSTVGTSLHCH